MTIQLSDTQRAILAAACARPDGAVFPIEAGVRGGALKKVLGALVTRGLVTGEGEALTATRLAWETLGLTQQEAPTGAVGPEAAAVPATYRTGTKQAQLIGMLRSEVGATIAEAVAATGWQQHTVRGAMAGALKKRLGLTITSDKVEGRGRVYRITA